MYTSREPHLYDMSDLKGSLDIIDIDIDASADLKGSLDIIDIDTSADAKHPLSSQAKQPLSSQDKRTLSLQLTALEHEILQMVAEGTSSPKTISTKLGIPQATVSRFLAKEDVKKYAQELINARNTAIKAYLPNLLMGIIESKLEKIEEDPEAVLADASKKDVVDIARVLNELLKASDAASHAQEVKMDAFSTIYAQINNIQSAQVSLPRLN